jgi:serine protease Do
VTRGFLGLLPQDVSGDLQKALNLPESAGALVGDVNADGPAAKAGVKRGDVILRFNGQKVENSTDLRRMVAQAAPGSDATLTVLRDGKEHTLHVVLGERPETTTASAETGSGESGSEGTTHAGMKVQDLRPDLAQRLGYEGDRGVLVVGVTPGGPADDAGIKSGDLIERVDQKPIDSVTEFQAVLRHHKAGDTIAILVRRKDNTFFTALQVS